MRAPVVLMVLVSLAVLVWPGRRPSVGVHHVAALRFEAEEATWTPISERLRVLAREDPVELARRAWRRRGRQQGDGFDESVLGLLDAIEPALRTGLTPARAFELAAGARADAMVSGGPDAVMGLGQDAPEGLAGLVEDAIRAAEAGASVGRVWERWAEDKGSRALGFVAAAWLLSERTGAPLADAVARAAGRTRAELSRRRRVSAAVAGPRATVNVLSALPLVGPLFGLASGLNPSEVYLSSPLVVVAVVVGLVLILVGRWWCRRLVRGVLEPT